MPRPKKFDKELQKKLDFIKEIPLISKKIE